MSFCTSSSPGRHLRGRRIPLLLMVVLSVFFTGCAASSVSADGRTTVGRFEPVLVATDDQPVAVEVQAKVDTAAELSSIDISVAEQLGIDVASADTIMVSTGVGREERPIVPVQLTVGDLALLTQVTITDRSDLTTAAGIGRADLSSFIIDPTRSNLTVPAGASEAQLADNRQLTLDGLLLLTVLPVLALLVIVFRSLVGLPTVGLFTPVLISLAFAQARSWTLVGIVATMLVAGFLLQPIMLRLDLTRVARLALLLISQVLVMKVAYSTFGSTAILDWVVAVPVIITLGLIENLWETNRREGFRAAAKAAVFTMMLTGAATWLLLQASLLTAMYHHPFITTAVCAGLCIVLGRYHGLRLTEVARFRQLRAASA